MGMRGLGGKKGVWGGRRDARRTVLVQVCEALHNGELFFVELDQKGRGGGEANESVCQSVIISIAESREDKPYPLSFPRPPV